MDIVRKALEIGATKPRTFFCNIPITGFVPGTLEDWPAHISEPIFECLERIEMREKIALKVLASVCRRNPEGFSLIVEAVEDRSAGIKVGNIIVPWNEIREP